MHSKQDKTPATTPKTEQLKTAASESTKKSDVTSAFFKNQKMDLKSVLDTYRATYKNPYELLSRIKSQHFWRFFIDGNRQAEGWLKFEEKEAGYLLAMMTAFKKMLEIDSKSQDLNDIIKKLHSWAVHGVGNLNYEDYPDNKALDLNDDTYRAVHIIGCRLTEKCVSRKGLIEIINMVKDYKKTDLPVVPQICIDKSYFTRNKVKKYRIIPDCIPISMSRTHMSKLAIKRLESSLSNKLIMVTLEHAIYDSHYQNVDHQLQSVAKNIDSMMKILINRYHMAMAEAKNDKEKLIAIFSFIHQCELFHPFIDANTRTFSMLLKNYLLISHGYPPMLCDENPNLNAGFSVEELYLKHIEKMADTMLLAKGQESVKLTTEEIVKTLSQDQKTYFDKVVAVAEECRKLIAKPKPDNSSKGSGCNIM